ncbi:hypothetical protein N658DRAFT_417273 [Parathielavia hyrcaniae]|uniref:Uncharacterized protein n=1 Tax=Parathielavia hyrcaniae TaxID=113614 RepID=A0AAN6QCE6_9PEZI|nr:hypothetical protein N658DRAFT_417273 [Parathielavia hyrcaniae]
MGHSQSKNPPARDRGHGHGLGLGQTRPGGHWDRDRDTAPYRYHALPKQPGKHSSNHNHNHNHHHHRRTSLSSLSQGSTATPAPPPAMPSFFSFQQGSERAQNVRYLSEASPLLGRFRAVPRPMDRPVGNGGGRAPLLSSSHGQMGLLSAAEPGWRGSVHVGYGALVVAAAAEERGEGEEEEEEDGYEDEEGYEYAGEDRREVGCCCADDGGRRWRKGRGRIKRLCRRLEHVWVDPKAGAIRRVVDVWWSRWGTLVVLPAFLAVAWCAIPFPQYPLPRDDGDRRPGEPEPAPGRKSPGHGATRVQVNFWFFLFVYYGFYSLTALIWITKLFNLYSLNWWPQSLGFPITVSAIAILSIAAPVPIYLVPEARFLTVHNTAWILWTFVIMAMPVGIAFCILMTNERHLKLRQSLSETQRIFTSSWWAGEPDSSTMSRRDGRRPRAALDPNVFDPALGVSSIGFVDSRYRRPAMQARLRRRWLPASFVRFVWFSLALFIGLLAYVIGEAYAEIYLSTLPHNNLHTIGYVYGWISTVYLLDGLTAWILGGNEGERVGSYPLSWIFKLYFMLTYQTYVRALYARLRSPSQFILLQVLSSTSLIIVTPILMSAPFHWFISVIGVNGQSYGSYQKMCIRNVFIRFIAENASMLAFLGSVVVLHFGANKDVYPYFAFDGTEQNEGYDFNLTFYASSITWACELVASFIVAGLIRWIYKVSVVTEGKLDFIVWPELLPTCVAVMLHVLQNMLFSIIRLQFR